MPLRDICSKQFVNSNEFVSLLYAVFEIVEKKIAAQQNCSVEAVGGSHSLLEPYLSRCVLVIHCTIYDVQCTLYNNNDPSPMF